MSARQGLGAFGDCLALTVWLRIQLFSVCLSECPTPRVNMLASEFLTLPSFLASLTLQSHSLLDSVMVERVEVHKRGVGLRGLQVCGHYTVKPSSSGCQVAQGQMQGPARR